MLLTLAVFGICAPPTEERGIAYRTGKDAEKERHTLDLYLPKGKKDFPVIGRGHGKGVVEREKSG